MTYDEGYDEGYRAGMQKMREIDRLRTKKKQIYEDLKDAVDREWVGLTDEEILDALGVFSAEETVFRIARAIEAELKEKNV